MTSFFTILTNYGKTALAEALAAQKPLEIPYMAAGDGGGGYYEPIEAQTNLRNERWRGDLNDLRGDETSQHQVIAEAIVPHGEDGDWVMREIGLFDAKGGLVAVGKYPETYVPSVGSGASSQIYISIVVHVGNTAALALIVNNDTVIASKHYVNMRGYGVVGSFEKGLYHIDALTHPSQLVYFEAEDTLYCWTGAFPKRVVKNSTPSTTGHLGSGGWLSISHSRSLSEMASIEHLKQSDPRFVHQIQSVLGFHEDSPYLGGGLFFSALAQNFEIDHWVVFPSADPNYVWVRQNREKERSILNCGAREGQDITPFLTFAAQRGLTVRQDNPFDVKTTGGIVLGKGLKIKGDDDTHGSIVLDSTIFDEIFIPNKTEYCVFKAERARFKAVSCVSNTPYVCGVTMKDPTTKLIDYRLVSCVLDDIGETSDMLYGYNVNVVKDDNTIKMSKTMIDKIVATGRTNLRGITRTNDADPSHVMTAHSLRYGRSKISDNDVEVYMPAGLGNQDIAKFAGMFNNQKVYGNHFHNTNLDAYAECDLYAGISSGVFFGNTFRNVSLKCMSLSNSGGDEYLSTFGAVVSVNAFLFDDGAVNNYGVYFKGDISAFAANTIRNNQTKARDQFIGIWAESNRGNGGFLDSQSPVGNVINGNVVDVQCDDYNGHYWRPIESASTVAGSVIKSNVFCGGSLREYVGGINSMSDNAFINVNMPVGTELRTHNGMNSRVAFVNGLPIDARVIVPSVGVVSETDNRKIAGIVTPWLAEDRGIWRLYVESSSSKSNNWQYFDVCANSNNGTISQMGGRKLSRPNNADELNTHFELVILNSSLRVRSIEGTADPVTIKYKWVAVDR